MLSNEYYTTPTSPDMLKNKISDKTEKIKMDTFPLLNPFFNLYILIR